MLNVTRLKIDVTSECRNQLYYNQLEIQRLIENPGGFPYKDVVDSILTLLERNVILSSSIDLMEQYIPTKQESAPTEPVVMSADPSQQ